VTGSLKHNLVSVTPYEIAATPDWVKTDYHPAAASQQSDSPQVFNLVDYQMRVGVDRSAFFSRTHFTVLDASRIDDASQFLYEVVPGSQQVVFHSCVINRGGKTIDALDSQNIRAVQRERELERQIASGRVTVELVIDDVRVGDSVELLVTEYDLAGEHPLYGRYFQANNWLSWGVPVTRQCLRIQNASDVPVHFRHVDSAKDIDTNETLSPGAEFERDWHDLPIRQGTPGVPDWFWPPGYFVTSSASWQSISQYLYNYYIEQDVLRDDVNLEDIDGVDWQRGDETTVLAIIDFVQNAVRYRGETDGIYSHTPKPPAQTLKKRSGDCKDKSNLLVCLLARVGVDAQLVLVNTRLKGVLTLMNPSPYLFDHMVVRFEYEGTVYFVDPTIPKQGGDLKHRARLNYQQALVLLPENGRLEPIDPPDVADLFSMTHTVDLRDEAAPKMTISRVYHGGRADNMRSYFASRESSHYQSDFEDYAKEQINVPLSRVEGISVVSDDTQLNYLSTSECYGLDLDDANLDNGMLQIRTTFHEDLQILDEEELPQIIDLDGELNHHIHVKYARKSSVDNDSYQKSNSWFDYSDVLEVDGNELHFKMTVKPVSNEVAVEDLRNYRDSVEEIRQRSVSQFIVKHGKSDTEVFLICAALVGLLISYSRTSHYVFLLGFMVIGLYWAREALLERVKALFKK
jgi:hypothetical protein